MNSKGNRKYPHTRQKSERNAGKKKLSLRAVSAMKKKKVPALWFEEKRESMVQYIIRASEEIKAIELYNKFSEFLRGNL